MLTKIMANKKFQLKRSTQGPNKAAIISINNSKAPRSIRFDLKTNKKEAATKTTETTTAQPQQHAPISHSNHTS